MDKIPNPFAGKGFLNSAIFIFWLVEFVVFAASFFLPVSIRGDATFYIVVAGVVGACLTGLIFWARESDGRWPLAPIVFLGFFLVVGVWSASKEDLKNTQQETAPQFAETGSCAQVLVVLANGTGEVLPESHCASVAALESLIKEKTEEWVDCGEFTCSELQITRLLGPNRDRVIDGTAVAEFQFERMQYLSALESQAAERFTFGFGQAWVIWLALVGITFMSAFFRRLIPFDPRDPGKYGWLRPIPYLAISIFFAVILRSSLDFQGRPEAANAADWLVGVGAATHVIGLLFNSVLSLIQKDGEKDGWNEILLVGIDSAVNFGYWWFFAISEVTRTVAATPSLPMGEAVTAAVLGLAIGNGIQQLGIAIRRAIAGF